MVSGAQRQRSVRMLELAVSRGLHGCPHCAQGQLSVGPEQSLIATPAPDTAEGHLPEDSAVVPVIRGDCRYTMLFSPRMLPDQRE